METFSPCSSQYFHFNLNYTKNFVFATRLKFLFLFFKIIPINIPQSDNVHGLLLDICCDHQCFFSIISMCEAWAIPQSHCIMKLLHVGSLIAIWTCLVDVAIDLASIFFLYVENSFTCPHTWLLNFMVDDLILSSLFVDGVRPHNGF